MSQRTGTHHLSADLLALLASSRAAPADDAPRLILADWLDENAEASGLAPDDARARADLIRVQVELARPSFDAARLAQLRSAEARLLTANAARWLGDLAWRLRARREQPFGFAAAAPAAQTAGTFDPLDAAGGWRFHRGLLTVELRTDELDDPDLAAWFASPLAAWVEEAAVELAWPDPLDRLRVPDAVRPYLGVRYALGADRSMRLGSGRTTALTAKRCRDVFRSGNFALVRALRIGEAALRADALAALVDAGVAGLRRLTLKGPAPAPALGRLAAAPLTSLSALDLSGCDVGPEGFGALVNSPHLGQLTALVAFRNRLGCDGLAALARSPLAGRLTVLEVQNTGAGDRGLAEAADSPLFERLVGPGLNLSMNPVSDAGAVALAKCPHLGPFTELILRDCRVGDAGAAALAESPHVANLTYLDLWKNRVGDAGARALARSRHLKSVRELSLRDNAITAAGARDLRKRFGDRVRV